jgi:hypothetical protein
VDSTSSMLHPVGLTASQTIQPQSQEEGHREKCFRKSRHPTSNLKS